MHSKRAQLRIDLTLGLGLALTVIGCTDTSSPGTQQNPQTVNNAAGAMAPVAGIGGAAGMTPVAASGGAGGASGAGAQPVAGDASGAAGMTAGAAGVGTTGGAGGDTPMAGTGADDAGIEDPDAGVTVPFEDLGEGDGKDVVTIGDSWMNIFTNGGGIEGGLDRAGTNYRHYAVAGTTLASSIPPQYTRAIGAGEIKTVIMTGGGNDIMFSNGCATKESCEMAVAEISNMLNELWTQMAEDGVKDVFYIQYSKNVGTAPSDTRPTTPPPPPPICLSGMIRCHSMSTTELVGPGDSTDGIHPTRAACDRIATAVLELMAETGARR